MISSAKIKDVLLTSVAILSVAAVSVAYDAYLTDKQWKEMLLKEGYAEYDKKTGDWKLSKPEVVLFNINDLEGKAEKMQIKIDDYLKALEAEVDKFQKQSEAIIEGVKASNGKKN
jgi:opacity protein-like surface antigen